MPPKVASLSSAAAEAASQAAKRTDAGAVQRRLVIRDIIVDNFKSYAGKHTIGPFHKTFTCVIGPNGSGKSNVIDAMLFVFGKAAKKIRLDKLAELVHNSALHPNLPYASVSVNFVEIDDVGDDAQQLSIVPNSLLTVTRDVQRATGTSNYYVQGKRSTQRDVIALLKGRGIDLDHNRFLILQGEVEQIALMKPKGEREGEEGLLEYFDDLIGSNAYAERIKAAGASAEALQEERLGGLDRLKRLEDDLAALDSAKVTTLAYVTKDNHLQRLLSVMCQMKKRETETALEEPRRLLAEIEAKIAQQKSDIQSIESSIAEREHSTREQRKQVAKTLKQVELSDKARQEADEELTVAKSNFEDIEKQRKKDVEKWKRAAEDVRKLQSQADDARRNVEIATSHLSTMRPKLENELKPRFDTQTEALEERLRPLRKRLEASRRAVAPYEAQVTTAQEAVESLRDRLRLMTSAVEKKQQEIGHLEKQHAQVSASYRDLVSALQGSEESARVTYAKVAKLEEAIATNSAKKSQLSSAIEQIKIDFRDVESDDKVSQFLNSRKDLKGYYGTLRSLGTIDNKYDVAAGVLGQATWGFHVVDNEETAAQAIQLLKDANMGRATFISLARVRSQLEAKMRAPFQAPAHSQRLFDLITFDAKFAPPFYFAVRDSLVTDTLAVARHLGLYAEPRHRVSTLRGELVEPSGAMTGGGAQPQGAKLCGSHVRVDKAKTREQLTSLQAELIACLEQEKALVHELSDVTRHAPSQHQHLEHVETMKLEIERAATSMTTIDERLRSSKAALARLQQQSTGNSEKRALDAELDRAETALEKAQKQHLAAKVAVDDVEREIENAGGPEYIALKGEVEALTKAVKDQSDTIQEQSRALQRLQSAIERKGREAEELKEKVEGAAQGAATEQYRIQLAELAAKVEAATLKYKASVVAHDAAESAVKETRDAVDALKEQARQKQNALQDTERALDEQLGTMKKHLEEIEKFDERVNCCDEKIRQNVTDFGAETLPQTDDQGRAIAVDMNTFTTRVASDEELRAYDMEHCSYMAKELHNEIRELKDTVDFQSVSRWRVKDEEVRAARTGYEETLLALSKSEAELDRLKGERKKQFLTVFQSIQAKLHHMYRALTNGGDAEIELVDSSDPFEGINYVVRPPKKSWKVVSNLSGGEKTLASLALVFALHHVKPTPIYVMDEIDAALDFRNVSIVARYVLERAIGAQFIIISLRNNMFELAHQLVGISKVRDCTQSIALSPAMIARKIDAMLQRQPALVTSSVNRLSRGGGTLVTCRNGPAQTTLATKRTRQDETIVKSEGQ